jgi:hypothetical protein
MVLMTTRLLPKQIRRVLTSRVEVSSERDEKNGLSKPLLVTRPEIETENRASPGGSR